MDFGMGDYHLRDFDLTPLLKLVKVNKLVFASTLLNRNLNHTCTAQLSSSWGEGIIILSVGLGGDYGKTRFFWHKRPFVIVNKITVIRTQRSKFFFPR